MFLKTVFTSKVPKPIGPYSQAIRVGPWLICSGQIPIHPESSQIVGKDIQAQTHQVLVNIQALLISEGMTLNHVVKNMIFLTDLNHFEKFNEIYASYFKQHKPARSCVEVSALPKSVLVEIETWAYKEESGNQG